MGNRMEARAEAEARDFSFERSLMLAIGHSKGAILFTYRRFSVGLAYFHSLYSAASTGLTTMIAS